MADYCDLHSGLIATTCFIFLIITIPLANSQPISFNYLNFSFIDPKQLKLDGSVSTLNSGIQLTENSNLNRSVGRVTTSEPFHLYNKTSNQLQDFITEFSFVIFTDQNSFGDGLTFFLASTNLPNVSHASQFKGGGIGIGLVDNQRILQTDYQFVAIEFDTFSNIWDPPGPHVGVNVNTMQSDILVQWLTDISTRIFYECSVEYSSKDSYLNVSFTGYIPSEGFVQQHLSYNIDLRDYLPEFVIVGISASTGNSSEEHTLLSWSFNTSLPSNQSPRSRNESKLIKLLEGIGVGLGFCFSLFGLVYFFLWKRNKGKEQEEEKPTSETISDLKMDGEFQMGTGPKKISYDELVSATNNFQDSHKLGKDGSGCVYKGYLKDSDSYAAIKRISADSIKDVKEFIAEVKIISQLRHRNLVKLNGWCHRKNDLFLIYEYMPNGSLDSHLFHRGRENFLSWKVRYNIALDLASALLYLQEEWEKCVLHRDIKSSNIMLDSNFNAKLGDFGLATVADNEKRSYTTVMAGTMGYLAPEYMNAEKARKESDIFSFGLVLLEIASGRKAVDHEEREGQVSLAEWVWELYKMNNLLEAADPKLCGEFDVQQMKCLLVLGLWCANPDKLSRPSIRQVIKVLNFEAPLPILPPHSVMVYTLPTADEMFFSVSSSFECTN